jgi:hypothetical protein
MNTKFAWLPAEKKEYLYNGSKKEKNHNRLAVLIGSLSLFLPLAASLFVEMSR